MSRLIAPSLLSSDFSKLGQEVQDLVAAGADWIHIDVMDGHFVNNLTMGAPIVSALRKVSPVFLDVHLMIDHPEKYLKDFITAGSDLITIHVESSQNVEGCLQQIKASGRKAGITLKPRTVVEALEPYWHLVDLVLVMTVEPGFGGQGFMRDQIPKLRKIREKIDQNFPHVLLQVDGGINAETAKECAAADVLVAGSYIFNNDYKQAIAVLKQ